MKKQMEKEINKTETRNRAYSEHGSKKTLQKSQKGKLLSIALNSSAT